MSAVPKTNFHPFQHDTEKPDAAETMTMRYAHLAPGGGELIGVLEQKNGNLMATEGGQTKNT